MITQIPLAALVLIFSGLLLILVNFITALTVGKRFDDLLRQKKIPLPLNTALTLPDSWGRGITYCMFVLVNGPRKKSGYGKLSKGFRFKQYARKNDFRIAWINVAVMLFFLISLLWLCGLGPKILVTFHT